MGIVAYLFMDLGAVCGLLFAAWRLTITIREPNTDLK